MGFFNREHVIPWDEKGCALCRAKWSYGVYREHETLKKIGLGNFVAFYHCEACGTYWCETDRYASEITREEIEELEPGFFTDTDPFDWQARLKRNKQPE